VRLLLYFRKRTLLLRRSKSVQHMTHGEFFLSTPTQQSDFLLSVCAALPDLALL
jgi:hypothetical protein